MKKTIFYHFILPKAQEEEYTKALGPNITTTTTHPSLQYDVVEIRHDVAAPPRTKPLPLYPWEITKVLTRSDVVGFMAALELSLEVVHSHLSSHWDDQDKSMKGSPVPIMVHDMDSGTHHDLVMIRKWAGGDDFYVIYGCWKKDFVDRRGLKEGMLIGLYWDVRARSLCFSLLEENGSVN